MRSVFAVIAGFFFTVIFSRLVDMLLHAVGFAAGGEAIGTGLALVAVASGILVGIVAGFLTARLAPSRPLRHALILGVVNTMAGGLGIIAARNLGLTPHWPSMALTVLAIPQCWVGGKFCEQLILMKQQQSM